jgi:hypothetical protein
LETGKIYSLKYRLEVFNVKFDAVKAELVSLVFAEQVEIKNGIKILITKKTR